jgi:glycosyltransferase involved in cell wall biosynthesis
MSDNINPLVSVCMITYNHSDLIAQAMEGVLMQKTSFTVELVISDDCSTDNTKKIIEEYKVKYPSLIKPNYNDSNLGLAKNFSQTLNKCKGKYIAICEGDDFWTDTLKLAKQIEFLESNPDCVIASHNFNTLYESENRTGNKDNYKSDFRYDQESFLNEWVTQPLTCMFRNIFRDYTFFNREGIFCDLIIFYELLKHGYGYFMKDCMATFRVRKVALSSGLSRWQWLSNHVIMFDYLNKYNERDPLLQEKSRKYCLSLFIEKLRDKQNIKYDFRPLKEYFKRNPGLLDGLVTVIVRVPYYILKYYLFNKVKSFNTNGR